MSPSSDRRHEVYVLFRHAAAEVAERAQELANDVTAIHVKNLEVSLEEWKMYLEEAKELKVSAHA